MADHIPRSPSYLVKHNHIFYFRIAVPTNLRPLLRKTEYRFSLKTAFLKKARRKSTFMGWTANRIFKELQQGTGRMAELTDQQIRDWVETELRQWLSDEEERMLFRSRPWTEADWRWHEENVGAALSELQDLLYSGDYLKMNKTADWILEKQGVQLDKDSLEYRKLCREILEADVRSCEIQLSRYDGRYLDEYYSRQRATDQSQQTQQPISPVTQSIPQADQGLMLSEAVKVYVGEKIDLGQWQQSTVMDNTPILNLFVDIAGDRPISRLTAEHVRDYRAKVMKLPKNMNKVPKYRDLPLYRIVAIEIPERDRISSTTVSNHYNKVGSFLNWAKMQGYIKEGDLTDILKIQVKAGTDHGRAVFTRDDLITLFSGDGYTKDTFNRSYQFWLPLIGLFSGARIEEICQLHLEDIRQDEGSGVWLFDINREKGKKVKTDAGTRLVPIHPFLLNELNFLGFVNWRQKRGSEVLFPELKPNKKGKYSHYASRRFGEYRKKVGVDDPNKVFHSFRHTFITRCKALDIPEEKVKEVVGHENKSITYGHYGKKYTPDILYRDVVSIIDFGIEDQLGHLKQSRWVKPSKA